MHTPDQASASRTPTTWARRWANRSTASMARMTARMRLVIEVVSPDSAASDRDLRPRHYAAAGIPHFWRVESTDFRPFVYSFELDADGAGYQVTGVHHTRLTVDSPFPITIDLDRLPR
ncbi:Uma2 family endonuclease [Microbispora bryophytorum]|uniref:Uma2 family endonuclease n=1 Tax=Microbispora bryophytorum TaxID=1460882 RepID=UPI00340D172A